MDNDAAFLATSLTYVLSAQAAPAAAIQIGPLNGNQITVKIYNANSVFSFVSYAATAALALSQCVAPVVGTPQNVLVLAPGEDGTFTVPPGQFWTAGASATGLMYLQFGYGI